MSVVTLQTASRSWCIWAVVFKVYRVLFVYKVHRMRSHCSEFPARGGGFLQRAPLGVCAFTVASCIHAKGTFIARAYIRLVSICCV